MAAHTYVYVTSNTDGNITDVTFTVDGFQVTIDIPHSTLLSFPSVSAMRNFLAPTLYKAAVGKGLIPPDPVVPDVVAATAGTFTQ